MNAQSAAPDDGSARLIVDASTLIRWSGPPVGIVRVESEFIRWVLDHEPAAVIAVFDTRSNLFRPLDPAVARVLVAGTAIVETSLLPDPRPIAHTTFGLLLRKLGSMLQPALKLRRTLACAVDEWRRSSNSPVLQGGLDRMVGLLLDRRLRSRALVRDGLRRDLYRLSSALGPPLDLRPRDTMLAAGLDWNTRNIDAIIALKARTPFRLAMMCYDMMPVVFPRFYAARDIEVFTRFYRGAILCVDRFISISKCTTRDLIEFARAQGQSGLDIRTEKLGSDVTGRIGTPEMTLPAGLSAGRYVLFVSTIEPRKNHALLLRVWKRLAAGEQGGTGGFKLVLVGRRGWMTQDVLTAMTQDPVLVREVVHVADASDRTLKSLYAGAAFCVYPSLYEGFGLPVVESFAYGKPVIASSGGALPEAAGGLAECLDPNDEDAWVVSVGRWLNNPAQVAEQARRIGAEFSWPTWSEALAKIVAVARET